MRQRRGRAAKGREMIGNPRAARKGAATRRFRAHVPGSRHSAAGDGVAHVAMTSPRLRGAAPERRASNPSGALTAGPGGRSTRHPPRRAELRGSWWAVTPRCGESDVPGKSCFVDTFLGRMPPTRRQTPQGPDLAPGQGSPDAAPRRRGSCRPVWRRCQRSAKIEIRALVLRGRVGRFFPGSNEIYLFMLPAFFHPAPQPAPVQTH